MGFVTKQDPIMTCDGSWYRAVFLTADEPVDPFFPDGSCPAFWYTYVSRGIDVPGHEVIMIVEEREL